MCAARELWMETFFLPFSPVIQAMCLEKITNLHLLVHDHQHFSKFSQSQKIIPLKVTLFLHTSNLA